MAEARRIALALCAWAVAALPPGAAWAQAEPRPAASDPIVVAGLRPTSAPGYQTTELKRLREAQRLRQLAADAVRGVTERKVLSHPDLRVSLGAAYLVSLFDCNGEPRCVLRVVGRLKGKASLVVYGDYAVKRRSVVFRIRLLDLPNGKLVREVEFSLEESELADREAWTRELSVLLAGFEKPAAGEAGEPPDGGGGGEEPPEGGGGEEPPEGGGGEEPPEGGGGGTAVAEAAPDADTGALDQLDAELDQLQGGGGGGGERGLVSNFRGLLASEFRSYPLNREDPKNDEQLLVEGELELDVRVADGVALSFRPRFLLDTFDTELTRFEPYAGYLQYTGDTWDVRLGQFVDNWGIADAFNPLDVLNRRDYAPDILDPPALGELGVRLRKQWEGTSWFGEPTISLYGIALWRKTLLPTDDYRYSLSQGMFVLVDDPEDPEPKDAGFGAVRIEHTLSTPLFAADFQYIGARGPTRFPNLIPVPQPDGTIQLVTEYFGTHIGGGGFRLVPAGSWLSKLTLKAEVVYVRPYSFEDHLAPTPDDYVQYVGGFDRVFNQVFSDLDSITFTAEYLGEELAADPLSQLRPFDNDIAARIFYEAKDFARTSVELRGVADWKTGELIGELTISRQLRFIHDDLSLQISGQAIRPYRDEPGFFAYFPSNNSNARTRLSFNF